MANYYTQFSFVLSNDDFPIEAQNYAMGLYRAMCELSVEDIPEGDGVTVTAARELMEEEPYDVGFSCIETNDGIWVSVDESGVPLKAAQFVLDIMRKHDIFLRTGFTWAATCSKPATHDIFLRTGFTWAATCSKPATDGFSGGAVLIAHNPHPEEDELEFFDASSWLDDKIAGL